MAVASVPRTWPTVGRNLSLLSPPGHAMSSTCIGYRTRVRLRRFAVSAVLYSNTSVSQTTKLVDTLKRENLTPLYECIYADSLTPVLAYRCLVDENDTETPSFLFESVDSQMETSTVGRYSVVGANPAMEIIAKDNSVTVMNHLDGWRTEEHSEEPMVIARGIAEKFHPRLLDELPEVFCGGLVGYFSYDTMRNLQCRPTPSSPVVDDMNLPDVYLSIFDDVLVFDHVEKKIYVIHWVQLDRFSSTEEALDNGTDRLQSLLSKVYNITNPRLTAGTAELDAHKQRSKAELVSTESEAYKKAVLKAKDHIVAGNINQLGLSQRFVRRTFSHPFDIYRTLGITNPSPFMAYLQVRGSVIVASSHETLTHIEPKRKKINGFHADSGNSVARLENAVLGNQFINAQYTEQIMLVHMRNTDAKNVLIRLVFFTFKHCKKFDFMYVVNGVEGSEYSVTDVGSTCWDALQTSLPTEAVTGSPKIKAMKMIDDLEPSKRFLHGGGIGSISFSGNMNIALSPKTIVFPTCNKYDHMLSYENSKSRREWIAHIHAGATVVANSDPRDVVRECRSEADSVARAIDLAESSFL